MLAHHLIDVMSLKESLDAFKEEFLKQVPDEVLEIVGRNMQALLASGQKDTVPTSGAFPSMTLKDSKGSEYALGAGASKPQVISFFRGFWWPYCVIELDALNAVVSEISEKGSELLVISPQLPEKSEALIQEKGYTFPILFDEGGKLADELKLSHGFTDELKAVYEGFGIQVGESNGTDDWKLPMPSRFITDAEGSITNAEINPDYTSRPEPADIVGLLSW